MLFLSCFCYAFMHICLLMQCGNHWERADQSRLLFVMSNCEVSCALDKLLGQFGIYATWLSYPQLRTCKNNCVFSYFFTPRFFL